jgi:hypothetical protein
MKVVAISAAHVSRISYAANNLPFFDVLPCMNIHPL